LDDTASTETRGKAIVDSFTFLAQEIAKESNVTLELDEPVTLPCKVTDDMDSFWAFFKVGLMFLILLFARFSRYFRGHSYGTHGGVRSHGCFGGGGRSFGGGHFGGGGAHR
ncbi:MAG: hypothetical protein J6X55_14600, partial [Victivallales bacterium]|nr:hypothetical protein [Victivallales bacterium]